MSLSEVEERKEENDNELLNESLLSWPVKYLRKAEASSGIDTERDRLKKRRVPAGCEPQRAIIGQADTAPTTARTCMCLLVDNSISTPNTALWDAGLYNS